ncbi:hypothetical protein, partial [Trinickia sp.]|uniref:hypothetical protein n=1 Tax=Trinickia sp. TaxID=2571163 RepID=UPI003F7F52BF
MGMPLAVSTCVAGLFLFVIHVLSLNLFSYRFASVAPARGGGHFSLHFQRKVTKRKARPWADSKG